MTSPLDPVLTSPGWELLAAIEAMPGRASLRPDVLEQALRAQGVAPDVARGVLAQLDLRDRAESVFGPVARSLVLTPGGLARATPFVLAAVRARRFLTSGATRVAEVGCGVGSDAVAMAGLGLSVRGFDTDEGDAAAASANLRAVPDTEVRTGQISDLTPSDVRAWGADAVLIHIAAPRPEAGARCATPAPCDPEQWSPPLSWALAWHDDWDRMAVTMPATVPRDVLPGDWLARWVSVDGRLADAELWSPALAPEGAGRVALVLRDGHAHTLTDSEAPAQAPTTDATADVRPGVMLARPDPAVVAAGLVGRLARDLRATATSPGEWWLTGDDLPPTPFASRFEVADVLDPGDLARETDRPTDAAPEAGEDPSALVLRLRIAGQLRTVVARRCHNE